MELIVGLGDLALGIIFCIFFGFSIFGVIYCSNWQKVKKYFTEMAKATQAKINFLTGLPGAKKRHSRLMQRMHHALQTTRNTPDYKEA